MLRLKLTKRLLGQYLAKPIYSREGRLLIAEETALTEPILKNLKDNNISVIYIAAFPDLIYKDDLFPDNQKILILNEIDDLHKLIKEIIPIQQPSSAQDNNKRTELYELSDKILRKISNIVNTLIDVVYYFDDKTLKHFIEYRFMF
ncbi:MAG TPA: hypothetical protein PLM75_10815, partial [bacterium]|nr:hypothetical protein [bacterium]